MLNCFGLATQIVYFLSQSSDSCVSIGTKFLYTNKLSFVEFTLFKYFLKPNLKRNIFVSILFFQCLIFCETGLQMLFFDLETIY